MYINFPFIENTTNPPQYGNKTCWNGSLFIDSTGSLFTVLWGNNDSIEILPFSGTTPPANGSFAVYGFNFTNSDYVAIPSNPIATEYLSGISGYSGFSGYSGISGIGTGLTINATWTWTGPTGLSGFSGYSGFSGHSGISGLSGISGFNGHSGISGYSGTGRSGYSGYLGHSGYSGFSINYQTWTLGSYSNLGQIKFLGAANSTTNTIYINITDQSKHNWLSFFEYLTTVPNLQLGLADVNGANYSYRIQSWSAGSGYYSVNVTLNSGSGTIFSGDACRLSFQVGTATYQTWTEGSTTTGGIGFAAAANSNTNTIYINNTDQSGHNWLSLFQYLATLSSVTLKLSDNATGANYLWKVITGVSGTSYFTISVTLQSGSGTLNSGDNCQLFWNI